MDTQGGSKYQVNNEGQLYGQVVGDNNQVIKNFLSPLPEVEARRRQFSIPILTSLHEIAPILAKLREAHDNLWERQKILLQIWIYAKATNALFKKAQERAAVA